MTTSKTIFQNVVEGLAGMLITPLACAPLEPDNPLELPDEDVLQLPPKQSVPDAGSSADITLVNADGDTTSFEIPTPMSSYDMPSISPLECQPGMLWDSLCLRFTEKAVDLGLQSSSTVHNKVKVFDIDNDGDLDLYLLNGEGNANELFINNGKAGFVESAASFGLNIAGESRDAVFGDYDQDGDDDMFLVGAFGSMIYENDGGVFKPAIGEKGIYNDEPGRTAKFIDGGMLLATENGIRFYKTIGQGCFEEATLEAELNDSSDVYAIATADYDGDGLKDVFLASSTAQNRLFRNLGEGKYESVDDTALTFEAGQSVSAEWFFLHPDDELPSLYVANFGAANQLFQNLGGGKFVDVAQELGLQDPGNTTVARFGDGLFLGRWEQENLLYRKPEDGSYQNIAYPMGMQIVGKTVSAEWFDYDNDGLLDLVVVMANGAIYLHHNESHWMTEENYED